MSSSVDATFFDWQPFPSSMALDINLRNHWWALHDDDLTPFILASRTSSFPIKLFGHPLFTTMNINQCLFSHLLTNN